ncbi:MAG: hypothetical protein J6Y82_01825 [Bacteroidales bacterium]|nr:hypothetical protein [Bacteroidales bacterium]
MIHRDYLLKMLQDLATAISALIVSKKPLTEKQRDVEALYSFFNRPADFFRSAESDELLPFLASFDDDLLLRAEMLAGIMYADARCYMGSHNQRIDIIRKALMLYQYVEQRSDQFSLDRLERIDFLQRQLQDSVTD